MRKCQQFQVTYPAEILQSTWSPLRKYISNSKKRSIGNRRLGNCGRKDAKTITQVRAMEREHRNSYKNHQPVWYQCRSRKKANKTHSTPWVKPDNTRSQKWGWTHRCSSHLGYALGLTATWIKHITTECSNKYFHTSHPKAKTDWGQELWHWSSSRNKHRKCSTRPLYQAFCVFRKGREEME